MGVRVSWNSPRLTTNLPVVVFMSVSYGARTRITILVTSPLASSETMNVVVDVPEISIWKSPQSKPTNV